MIVKSDACRFDNITGCGMCRKMKNYKSSCVHLEIFEGRILAFQIIAIKIGF